MSACMKLRGWSSASQVGKVFLLVIGCGPTGIDDTSEEVDATGDADCVALAQALVDAFEDAVTCDPASSSPQCDGVEMMTTSCGCPWAANSTSPELAQAARDAWIPYEAEGCLPEGCGLCPEPAPTFRCAPLPVGTMGTCSIDG